MISLKDKRMLRDAGFLPFEIRQIHFAKAVDKVTPQKTNLYTAAWQASINSRRYWIQRMLDAGWSRDEMARSIRRFYKRRGKRDVFAFLKIEYKDPKRLSDFQWALKMRLKIRVSRDLGKGYSTPMKRQLRPFGKY